MPTAALFVTCVLDQLDPDAAVGAVMLLEAAGVTVEVPERQTCCGQPGITAGEPEAAARLAGHFLDVFERYDAVVAPSGSCAGTVHHWFERLLPHDAERVRRLADRTFELTGYLVDVLGREDLGARLDTSVAVLDSCHGMRHLGVHDAPRRLLAAAGATIVELSDPETCCGFGGVFAVGHPVVSTALADEKLLDAASTEAEWITGCDAACLLHLAGRRRRTGIGPKPVHVATLLASGLAVGPSLSSKAGTQAPGQRLGPCGEDGDDGTGGEDDTGDEAGAR